MGINEESGEGNGVWVVADDSGKSANWSTKICKASLAPPSAAAPAPPPSRCDGVEIAVGIGNERRCLEPGAGKSVWFKDCPDCPEMVAVPAGSFTMGSPPTEHERDATSEAQVAISIARPFAVGRFAVTVDQYEAFVRDSRYRFGEQCRLWDSTEWRPAMAGSFRSPGFPQTGMHPAVCIDWNDAKAYVAWLSRKAGKTYRLLSSAEREYVTRAGTTTPFWWGARIGTDQANYNGIAYGSGARGEFRRKTLPVDTFAANPWGLYNVHGNVVEWVEDCDNTAADTGPDCKRYKGRGGSWVTAANYLRAARLFVSAADHRQNTWGFRVARTLD